MQIVFLIVIVVIYKNKIVDSIFLNDDLFETQPADEEMTIVISLEHNELFNSSRGVIFREIELIPKIVTKIELQNFDDFVSGYGIVHVHGYGNDELIIEFDEGLSRNQTKGYERGRHLGFVVFTRNTNFSISGDYSENLVVLFAFVFNDNGSEFFFKFRFFEKITFLK